MPGRFDRFADAIARLASRAPFFGFCILIVLIWLIQGVVTVVVTADAGQLLASNYQLEINTTTTIITFLLVALLHNTQTRFERAVNGRLEGIIDTIEGLDDPVQDPSQKT